MNFICNSKRLLLVKKIHLISLSAVRNSFTYYGPKCSVVRKVQGPQTLAFHRSFSSTPSIAPHEINTKLTKDVILFKFEDPRFFNMLFWCAASQYFFWMYLSYFTFTSMRDAPVDRSKIKESDPWFFKINLGDTFFRNVLGTSSLIIGAGIFFSAYLFTVRSVRYLVLHKGGKELSFVTYNIMGANRIMKVPIDCVSCTRSRASSNSSLPVKIKNYWFYFLIDMRGEFKNPQLFDYTAGLKRSFK